MGSAFNVGMSESANIQKGWIEETRRHEKRKRMCTSGCSIAYDT